jgi:Hemerythrin HHE cation binding domain
MTDIIELVLSDHRRIRQLQKALHDTARYDPGGRPGGALARMWDGLARVIELHLSAEQEICWLPMCGTGPRGREQIAAAAAGAADITAAIGEARLQPAGSPIWWRAVRDALSTCAAQFGREEHAILADFARHAAWPTRDQLGHQWLAFTAARRLDETPAGPDSAVCRIRRQPVPERHHHVPDTGPRAVRCTCHACARAHARAVGR